MPEYVYKKGYAFKMKNMHIFYHFSRSEVLLNGIQQLVDEVLSLKGHGFCLKIDKQVDKFLNPQDHQEVTIQNTTNDNSVYNNNTNLIQDEGVPSVEDINNRYEPQQPQQQQQQQPDSKTEINDGKAVEETEVEEVGMEIDTNEIMDHINEKSEDVKEKITTTEQESEEQKLVENIIGENTTVEAIVRSDKHEKVATVTDDNVKSAEEDNSSNETKSNEQTECIKVKKEQKEEEEEESNNAGQQTPTNDEPHFTDTEKVEKVEGDHDIPEIGPENLIPENNESADQVTANNIAIDQIGDKEEEDIKDEGTPELDGDALRETSLSYYTSLQTEPISDESPTSSVNSYEQISDEDGGGNAAVDVKVTEDVRKDTLSVANDNDEEDVSKNRRKSHRNRKAPSKYQQQSDNNDDAKDTATDASRQSDEKSRSTRSATTTNKQDSLARDSRSDERSTGNSSSSRSSRRKHEKRESSTRHDTVKSEKRKRSRSPRDRKSRDDRNSSRSSSRNKRAPTPEERISKRPRRPTKQRERFSPS